MKKFFALCWIVVFLYAGCKNKEQKVVPTAEKMHTNCIGRHLIDLPADFVQILPLTAMFSPSNHDAEASPIDVGVLAAGITEESFGAALLKRRGEIVTFSDDTTDILKEVLTRGNFTLFRIQRIKESYTSELHLLKDGFHIAIEEKSYQGRFDEAEKSLFVFAKEIVPVNTVSDSQTGFCLGAVVVQGANGGESTSMTFRSDKRPDILISIDIDTYGRDDPVSLLQRVSGPNSLLEKFDARNQVLRKGELRVAGMRAEEWLGSVKLGENRDRKQLGFALETRRPKPGPASPRIHIELDTAQNDADGKKHVNSLTDTEALALWDSIITSIRLRPVPASNEPEAARSH
jgi:hypothetical protein